MKNNRNGQQSLNKEQPSMFQAEGNFLPNTYNGLLAKETNELLRKNWTAIRDFSCKNRYILVYIIYEYIAMVYSLYFKVQSLKLYLKSKATSSNVTLQ